jgi:putative holliday junction resolvase
VNRQGDKETGRQGDKDKRTEPLSLSPCLPVSLSPCLPPKGALLGVDYGTKRIGVAVCDPDRLIASPLGTASHDNGTDAYFSDLVARSKFVGIVVGLPLHANGDESDMSQQARAFAKRLAELTNLPVVMWDERCTSAAAEDALLEAKLTKKKRKAKVDRVAAQMILQSFIDSGSPAEGTVITPRDSSSPTED